MERNRIEQQLDLFASTLDEKYVIPKDKKVYLIELFAGCGSQHRALHTLLGDRLVSWKICDWMFTSMVAYNSINIKDYTDYSQGMSKEQLIANVRGISTDEKKPLTDEQLNRKSIDWLKLAYNSKISTHNLLNVMDAKGEDFELEKCQDGVTILCYSFPCQDISMAGRMLGYEENSNTRSSMLWQVKRILYEMKSLGHLPKILLLENVPGVCGSKNLNSWKKWLEVLEDIGYTSKYSILNAKDYGIPQNRRRCFLVSLLDESVGSYEFPRKLHRKYYLRDFCDRKVAEKYYLSQKMINFITTEDIKHQGSLQPATINKSISNTITTREGCTRAQESNYLCEELPENTDLKLVIKGNKALTETLEKNEIGNGDFIDSYNRAVRKDGIAGTITTRVDGANNTFIAVELKRGYECDVKTEKQDNTDEIDIIGNYSKSGYKQTSIVGKNGIAPTITNNHGQVTAIAIKNNTEQGYLLGEVGDGVDISGRMQNHRGTVQKGIC